MSTGGEPATDGTCDPVISRVAHLLNGDEGYGVGKVIEQYASLQPDTLFICMADGQRARQLRDAGNRVVLVDGLRNYVARGSLGTLLSVPRLLKQAARTAEAVAAILDREGVRIVHVHWLSQFLTCVFLRRRGIKAVWHIHNNMSRTRLAGLGVKLNRLLASRGADVVLAVSDAVAEPYRGSGPAIRVVHNAARPLLNEPPAMPPRPPLRLVLAGRLVEDKGFHTAVQAVRRLRDEGRDVTLDCFGGPLEDNPYVNRLQSLIGEHADAIRLMGMDPDVRRRLGDYHLALQCRISPEPCSVWVCECHVDGLPLLATATGGTPELVIEDQTGRLFPPDDAGALTALIRGVLDDPATLDAWRQVTWQRGVDHFRLERLGRETREIYADLLDDPASSRS